MTGNVPPGVPSDLITPQGNMPAIGIPNSQDYARLIFSAPYFEQIPIAEIIQPSVTEAVEAVLPSLVPPYVDSAVLAGVQQYAVLLTGSTMSGPLFLSPLMPTADAQAATKAYVDTMLSTAGIPEVPPVPVGQIYGRETGQWVPISQAEGTFLPITGGTMQGNINMSGNTLTNMAAVPAMPNGAAPAQWVLNQIASVSLYQGTWDADTNTPDLTQLSTHVNAYTWIAITTSVSGVVIGQAIPGLQGQTVFNGDTIIYSTAQGQFSSIHAGGISLPEADGRYVQLAGSQMSGALLLNANASQNMQAVTFQQLEAAVANTVTPDAPADGQGYLRVGVGTNRWVPGLPLAGGILTGALTLSGPGASGNNAVTVTQLNSAITGVSAGLMPIAGGTFTGAVILNGNASANLNPVPLQQLNAMLATYATQAFVTGGFLPLSGGQITGNLGVAGMITGSLGIGTTVPSGAAAGTLIAGGTPQAISATDLAGNVYFDGTNWRYLANGAGWLFGAGASSSGWSWLYGGSGAPGAVASFSTTALTLNGTGNLNATGTVGAISGGTNMNSHGITYGNLGAVNAVGFVWQTTILNCMIDGGNVGVVQITASDEALKENFAPLSVDCLATLEQVALQQFDWKPITIGDATMQKLHASCGFTAQALQDLVPEAIVGQPGNLGVDLLPLVSYCIGAIQQLASRLSALEAPA